MMGSAEVFALGPQDSHRGTAWRSASAKGEGMAGAAGPSLSVWDTEMGSFLWTEPPQLLPLTTAKVRRGNQSWK